MRTRLVLGCFVSILFTAHAQSGHRAPKISPMREIYVQDQRDRGVMLSDAGEKMDSGTAKKHSMQVDGKTMERHDAERRKLTRALMSEGKLITAHDFHDAAVIFQHGQTADDYLLAHILAIEAVVKGDASSKWISAATLDRYLQAIGKPQVFGTQYLDHDFLFMQQHKSDPAAMSNYKRKPGMTQQPYNDLLMPDALRLDFCVPKLSQQKANLKEFESGKYPASILASGCTR